MKSEILRTLMAEKTVVSGERLSGLLNISRVAVWKHIKKLQELGYKIESSPRGYELLGRPDIPYSWEFPNYQDRVHYFAEVVSTMDIARDLARKGVPHFSAVVADRQSKGRGRLDRQWYSENGGVYFTIIIRPEIAPVMSFKFGFSASVALVRVIREFYVADAKIKWPNDILVDKKKLSGMLSEMETESDLVKYMNIGMGINVNNDPRAAEPEATSLKIFLKRNVSRVKLLERFLNEFESILSRIESEDIVSMWKQYSDTLNRPVKIVTIHEQIEGIARDVDETGALVLELSDGFIRRMAYGDCFYSVFPNQDPRQALES